MKRKVLVVVAIASALILTSCSSVTMAAKVGKKEITTKEVQTSITNILKERTKFDTSSNKNIATGAQLNLSVLQFHLYSALFDAIAAGAKIPVTDGDIAKERASLVAQVGSEDKLPFALANASIATEDFPRYLRSVVIVAKIKQALVASGDTSTDGSGLQNVIIAAGKREGVVINPRYGAWDVAAGSIKQAPANPAIK